MSMWPVDPLPLPATYTRGFVQCNVVQITADSTDDADRFPEARPAKGKIVFHPLYLSRKVVEDKAFALHQDAIFDINDQGEMVDAQGLPGAWIVTGSYEVEFKVAGGTIRSFVVTVTAAHTVESPLWLPQIAPFEPVPGVPVTTLVVPSGPGEGQVLAWIDGKLMWVTGGGGGGGTWGSIVGSLTAQADLNAALNVRQSVVRYSGTAWPPRPTGAAFGVLFISTNSASAPPPPATGLQVGDMWRRHPNAI